MSSRQFALTNSERLDQQLALKKNLIDEISNKNQANQKLAETLLITNDELIFKNKEIAKKVNELARQKHVLEVSEAEIKKLAFYDTLTELPNRRLLTERLQTVQLTSSRTKKFAALLFLDMDRFKALNDTLGHDYGDLMLIEVAHRLRSCVREVDTVARLGGDEFIVLLNMLDEQLEAAVRHAALIAENIRATLASPYQLKNTSYTSSPSIGVTLFHGKELLTEDLYKQADMAMYKAKSAGRNRVFFFDPQMEEEMVRAASLETEMRHALTFGEMHLYYQLQMDKALRPIGAEAFIRWNHPVRGMIYPIEFIPLAEESSLIVDIDDWVIDTAAQQLKAWSTADISSHLKLAINISAKQFAKFDFVEKMNQVLEKYAFDPTRLELELTEVVVINNVQHIVNQIGSLKNLGLQISLDDLGSGYSALSYLSKMSLDQIKTANSFAENIALGSRGEGMVNSIIDMRSNLTMEVIAEGRETESQLALLTELGFLFHQGYWLSKPLPIREFNELLKRVRLHTTEATGC